MIDVITRSPSLDAGAVFSPCERYRYLLWRQWRAIGAKAGTVLWCMLNPSTATELALDPTLTRCKGFTETFGYARFEVVNAYALRSTDPKGLLKVADPVGPANDEVILKAMRDAELVVVGWGAFPLVENRALRIAELAAEAGKPMHCLGVTRQGHPRHPLYLAANTQLQRWGGVMGALSRIFWWFWLPDYEGGGPWHLRWRAWLAWQVRRAWYHGKKTKCICHGCDEQVAMASASGLCGDCINEDCQHVDPDDPLGGPRYWEFLAETAKTCRAREKPCPGCCAGGMCDGELGGRFSEDYDPDDDRDPGDDGEDD